ncbi:hypothetical protein XENTR_v10012866 [Xenopus tropicalis]|nr:hypothetical protein XENTR_v10012866 [Xenopus tropicalis]
MSCEEERHRGRARRGVSRRIAFLQKCFHSMERSFSEDFLAK